MFERSGGPLRTSSRLAGTDLLPPRLTRVYSRGRKTERVRAIVLTKQQISAATIRD